MERAKLMHHTYVEEAGGVEEHEREDSNKVHSLETAVAESTTVNATVYFSCTVAGPSLYQRNCIRALKCGTSPYVEEGLKE